jgi:hypothetical protein
MTVEDALRKIALLRKISTDNGAVAAEAENAHRLQKILMERYAINASDIPEPSPTTTVFRLNWNYWNALLEEFGLRLNHFGGRGSAEVTKNMVAYIMLGTSDWWIKVRSPNGWQTTTRGRGVESLRKYLNLHAPRSYSFFRR